MANRVRRQLFILAYNLMSFLRRLYLPETVKHWSLRSVQTKLIETVDVWRGRPGDWCFSLPRWLQWLPKVGGGEAPDSEAARAPPYEVVPQAIPPQMDRLGHRCRIGPPVQTGGIGERSEFPVRLYK